MPEPRQINTAGVALPVDPISSDWRKLVVPHRREADRVAVGSQPSGQLEMIRPLTGPPGVSLYEAWDHDQERSVAVYRVSVESAGDAAEAVNDLIDRARLQAGLHHPNVISIHWIDKPRGRVVSECCVGSLADSLRTGAMPPEQVERVVHDALTGLAAIHATGLVHGELCPTTVRVSQSGVYKLDRSTSREPGSGFRLRPEFVRYTAPECIDEDRFGPVSYGIDLYGLGMLALELLAGDGFERFVEEWGVDLSADEGWLRWHTASQSHLRPTAELVPSASPRLAELIDRLLSKHVSRRPKSAEEALELLGGHTPGAISPVGSGVRTAPSTCITTVEKPGSLKTTTATSHSGLHEVPTTLANRLQGLLSENNSGTVAALLLLVAAFVAGSALVLDSGLSDEVDPLLTSETRPEVSEVKDSPKPQQLVDSPPLVAPTPVPFEMKPATSPPMIALPSPPPQPGRLVADVSPHDALMTIDGRPGPESGDIELDPGQHTVTFTRWDCEPFTRTIRVREEETSFLSVSLVKRPAPPKYQPVLVPPSDVPSPIDKRIRELLGDVPPSEREWTSLTTLEYWVRRKANPANIDGRLYHALAVVMRLEDARPTRAVRWYRRAATACPRPYSWASKGLITCLFELGKFDEAQRECQSFATAAVQAVRPNDTRPLPRRFLSDTARFLGQACVWVEYGYSRGRAETFRDSLIGELPPELGDVLVATYEAQRKRLAHHLRDGGTADATYFFGDTLPAERRVLLNSIGLRKPRGDNYRLVQVAEAEPTAMPTARGLPDQESDAKEKISDWLAATFSDRN